jgi:hypothetical protein
MNGTVFKDAVFKDIEKLEADLWEAADQLRANSKLTSSDYFMRVLGIIFLPHAANIGNFFAPFRPLRESSSQIVARESKLTGTDAAAYRLYSDAKPGFAEGRDCLGTASRG